MKKELPNIITYSQVSLESSDLKVAALPVRQRRLVQNLRMSDPANGFRYWCWAIVAEAISRYYNNADFLSQCEIAGRALQKGCCAGGQGNDCDHLFYLDLALEITGNLYGMYPENITFAGLEREIDLDYPLCLYMAWNGGHFVIATATGEAGNDRNVTFYSPGTQGEQYWNYDDLINDWDYTYFTTP